MVVFFWFAHALLAKPAEASHLEIRNSDMPPPDLSQHESLALSQAKALARAGIDPNEASSASAFLEDELGGFYYRLDQDRQGKQQIKQDGEMQPDADHASDNDSNNSGDNNFASEEEGGTIPRRQEEEEESR